MIKHSMKNTLLYALMVHLLLTGISPHTSFAQAAKGVNKRIAKNRVPRMVNNSRILGNGSSSSYSGNGYNNYRSNNNSNSHSNSRNQNGYNTSGYNGSSNYSNNINNSSTSKSSNGGFGFWAITGIIALVVLGTVLAYLAVPQIMCSHKKEKVQAQKAKEASSYQRYSEPAIVPAGKQEALVIGGIPGSKYKSPRGSDVMTL